MVTSIHASTAGRDFDVALIEARRRFPFPGYMDRGDETYREIAATVSRHVPRGGKLLDVGAGACDKTAVLSLMGFDASACDDLRDPWHLAYDSRERILAFTRAIGVDFRLNDGPDLPFGRETFDMVMVLNMLEHLHDSPRSMLSGLLQLVRSEGFVLITVPNAVNVRKRLAVVRGRTNMPPFDDFFWSTDPWRGHVREYVKDDLKRMVRHLRLETVELRSYHHMLWKLPRAVKPVYRTLCAAFEGWRDSWLLVARKPAGWAPGATHGSS
jgi:SAM-dependent methyltransferase